MQNEKLTSNRAKCKIALFILLSFLLVCPRVFSEPTGKKVTIRYLTFETQYQQILGVKKIIAEFEQRYPHIKVQLEPNSEASRIFLTDMAAGTPPDVMYVTTEFLAQLVAKNGLLDLNAFVARDSVDFSVFFSELTATLTFNGHLYAYPIHFSTNALFYNKTLFNKAGIPYPDETWTWDEYKRVAKKLTKDTNGDGKIDQFGTLIPDFRLLIPSFGGQVFDENLTRLTVNSPETLAAVTWAMSLYGNEAPTTHQTQDTNEMQLFENDRVAFFMGRTWQLARLSETMKEANNWDIAPTPKGKIRYSMLAVGGHCIARESKHPDETWEFVKFYSSAEGQRLLGKQKNCVPGTKEVAFDQNYFMSSPPESIQVFIDAVDYSTIDIPDKPWKTEFMSRVWDQINESIRTQRITPAAGLKLIEERGNKFLEEYRAKPAPVYTGKRILVEKGAQLVPYLVIFAVSLFVGALIARRWYPWLEGYLFISPWLIGFIIFIFAPVIASFLLSFAEYDILTAPRWVGFKNYVTLFSDPLFLKSLNNTLYFSAVTVPLGLIFSLLLAMLLNVKIRSSYTFRVIYYLPAVTSGVAISLLWRWLFNPDIGLVNYFLSWFGIEPLGWLTSTTWAMPAVMIMSVWGSLGGPMLIYLAGLQGIPDQLYEAADLDGANFLQRFRHVTIPMLSPAIFFNLIMAIIGSFQVFTAVYVMTSSGVSIEPGGPAHSTLVYVLYLYRSAFRYLIMGQACAMAWFLFLIILALTLFNFKLAQRWVHYEQS
ncbi:MAG: extracellular solute-binding protein [bacterium]|nr:extracellular solute-binding protein [bacterium]